MLSQEVVFSLACIKRLNIENRLSETRHDRIITMEVERAGMLRARPCSELIRRHNLPGAVDHIEPHRNARDRIAATDGRHISLKAVDFIRRDNPRPIKLRRHPDES